MEIPRAWVGHLGVHVLFIVRYSYNTQNVFMGQLDDNGLIASLPSPKQEDSPKRPTGGQPTEAGCSGGCVPRPKHESKHQLMHKGFPKKTADKSDSQHG